MSVRTLLVIW